MKNYTTPEKFIEQLMLDKVGLMIYKLKIW